MRLGIDAAQNNRDEQNKMAVYLRMVNLCGLLHDPFAIIYSGERYLEIAEENGDEDEKKTVCLLLAKAHISLEHYGDALVCSAKCLEIAEKTSDKLNEMCACLQLSKANYSLQKYNDAIVYGKKCLEIASETRDISVESQANIILINAYQSLQQYKDVIRHGKRGLQIAKETGNTQVEMQICAILGNAHQLLGLNNDVFAYGKRCLEIAEENGDKGNGIIALVELANAHNSLKQYDDAIVYCERIQRIAKETRYKSNQNSDNNVDKVQQMFPYRSKGALSILMGDPSAAVINGLKYLKIAEEVGDKDNQQVALLLLFNAHQSLSQYDDAIVYSKRCLDIAEETGAKSNEMFSCFQISLANNFLQNYNDAIVYGKRCLDIADETGDKDMEMCSCSELSTANYHLQKYNDAIVFGKRCFEIAKETNNMKGESVACEILLRAYVDLKQYENMILYCKRLLQIAKITSDKQSELSICSLLSKAYRLLEQYSAAIEYGKACLELAEETDNKEIEIIALLELARAYYSLEQYDDTIEYSKRCVEIAEQNRRTNDEMNGLLLLAKAYNYNEQFHDAIMYGKKCLEIAKKTGDNDKEIDSYEIFALANINAKLSDDALSYGKKWLENINETCDKIKELNVCTILAEFSIRSGRHDDSIVYSMRSLEIAEEIGNQDLKVIGSLKLFDVYIVLQQYDLAFSYFASAIESSTTTELLLRCEACFECFFAKFRKALAIRIMILGKIMLDSVSSLERLVALQTMSILYKDYFPQYEWSIAYLQQMIEINIGAAQDMKNAFCYFKIAQCHELQSNYQEAIQAYQLAFSNANKSGCLCTSLVSLYSQGALYFKNNDIDNAISVLEECLVNTNIIVDYYSSSLLIHPSIPKIRLSEEEKIVRFHELSRCHKLFAEALLIKGKVEDALLQLEHCRGRLLLEQLLSKYDMTRDVVCQRDLLTFTEIQSFVSNFNCSILFYLVGEDSLHRFLIEGDKVLKVHSQTIKNCDKVICSHINKFLAEMRIHNVRNCENRSLDHLLEASRGERAGPPSEGDDESSMESESEALFHILFRGLPMDELKENLVIIPDGPLFRVPFAALQNPDPGRNKSRLFETKCIRILPSIQTLIFLDKENPTLLQNYDNSLIIGNPEVGTVILSGKEEKVEPLPNAEKEAVETAHALGVEALIGRYANKPGVFRKLRKSNPKIIHVAAHGFIEKSTIALAPSYEVYKIRKVPIETDYMLTMKEVQRAKVHTKLAVLGYCHSGCGETPVEGVIGMCRAFLASGARAVLSSLWAIDDGATLEFMRIFYRNLKGGKSAGTSLTLTMGEMKNSSVKYKDPKYWAPFFLMGEDVTVDIPDEQLKTCSFHHTVGSS